MQTIQNNSPTLKNLQEHQHIEGLNSFIEDKHNEW